MIQRNEQEGSAPASQATKFITLEQPLPMYRGGELADVTLAYETWGEDRGDNHLVIFTGLSPDAHAASCEEEPAAGWWEAMVGPGKPIDSNRFHVICFNSLGSCFGSTGPASTNPATGKPWGVDFPLLLIEDVARSANMALKQMGISRLKAIVGPSMGGMTALAYALQFPTEVDHVVSISSALAAEPYAIAVRSLQRELIRSDAKWQDGHYPLEEQPVEGMRLARKLGMTSYRSAAEWRERFGRQRIHVDSGGEQPGHPAFPLNFEVEGYLQATADKFVGDFDANCYQYLSRAMDLFDASEHGSDPTKLLEGLRLDTALVIGVETDALFPIHQQVQLADALRQSGVRVKFERLPSIQGHDAFLVDMDRFAPTVEEFLAGL
ncbi:MAG: homoserine O-acetyltransferase [Gammaproteobacteria bacterium]|nr:homoserine O-acetyltransferase [Gammaproteobacteria bacterium]